ncbi:hypothetical protein BDV97DRAFT_424661 [Delphinella strobiligena]|nr:hypothetical protein BDV97DRAFT_424661 [Delphinella strobiligena]
MTISNQSSHDPDLASQADSLRYLFEHAPLTAERLGSVPVLHLARTTLQTKAPRPWTRERKQTNHLCSPLRESSPLSPGDTPKATTLQKAVSSPSRSSTATGSVKCAEQEPTICSFFFHFGSCRRDPKSSTYDGSAEICKFVHSLGIGTETLKVQKIPKRWHKEPCGLDRCPQSGGTRKGSKLAKKAVHGYDGAQSEPGNVDLVTQPIPEDVIRAQVATPLTVRVSSGQFNEPQTTKANSAAHLKASEVIEQGNGLLYGNKNEARKRKRMDEIRGQAVTLATTRAMPKTLSTKAKRHAGEICFFWYHGSCRRGRQCRMLHKMTNPPSFVQLPPGYVHYVPCGLEWCPGDKRHECEHEHEHVAEGNGSAKRLCTGSGGESGAEEGRVGQRAFDGNFDDEEWFLEGFAGA